MREVSVPAVTADPITENICSLITRNEEQYPDRVMFTAGDSSTVSRDVTAAQFAREVRATAKGLIARGLEHGQRIGVLAANCYQWSLLDCACWAVGIAPVPIYETSSPEQINWIVSDSGCAAVAVGTPELGERVTSSLSQPIRTWLLNAELMSELAAEGQSVADEQLGERMAAVRPADIATIVYTSGTTGRPRGCVLTHSNFVFEVRNVAALMGPLMSAADASTVLFLPLAHIYARFAEVLCLECRTRIVHCASVRDLPAKMIAYKPTFIVAVPRVFEKIYNGASQKAHDSGRGKIFDIAAEVAIAYARARAEGGGPSFWLRVQHTVFDKLVYGKVRAALGGRTRYAISGGASLSERLGYFYAGIGLLVIEGYGLTETTGVIVFNPPARPKVGTVGLPMPGSAVRIADDGEIWLRGGNVMPGYFNNPAATAEALDAEGWFHTGDVGALDADGYLRITGRKKEIIITAGGKNVAPVLLEDRVQSNRMISHCIVVGEARPFVGALVTLDPEALEQWAKAKKKPASDVASLRDDPDLVAEIQKTVDFANRAVSQAESIRAWRILERELSEETGHITQSQKLKRAVIVADFADDISALYSRRRAQPPTP